jgi:hypothetical protein
MGADVTTAVLAVVGIIESRTALLLRGDGASVSPCPDQPRGWRAGCRGTSIERLLTRVAQRLLDKAKQGSEAVARLGRRALGVGEVSGAMLGAWGPPTWMESNPRATGRSWENPTCGAMTRSPLTEMKEDHSTAVTCARMSRELRVHHLPPAVMARATPRTSAQWGRAHHRSSALCVTPGHGLAGCHHHSRRDRYTEL